MRRVQRYGWNPDHPDRRDLLYAAPQPPVGGWPVLKSLKPIVGTVFDQGDLGSCTGNGISGVLMMVEKIEKDKTVAPASRLFIYYNERVLEGTVNEDAGAMIRDGIKTVASQGACLETIWPYDVNQFATKPSDAAYADAKLRLAIRYARISHGMASLRACLASGFPFVFGFSVYESFESNDVATTGIVPMPLNNETMVGGHCVDGIGYNDGPDFMLPNGQKWPSHSVLCQNSWGPDWGLRDDYAGCFTMPYQYITSGLATDFWVIKQTEDLAVLPVAA